MRDVQGWVVSEATESSNIDHAARFTCYVLVNRLCFYNALRRKYPQLSRLIVPNSVKTGEALQQKLSRSFNDAKRFTGNYETVFDGDFGDDLPFLSDDAVTEWRALIRSLDHYDFAHISLDVIGAMYEQLIKPAERHRYGQHYTQPSVVDLITAFAITNGQERALDPGCGGGTFLVRAYARKSYLDPGQDHAALLEALFGCDVLNYACHLSIINLAIRDLIDDDNFPRIHLGDFLRFRPDSVFIEQPVRIQAGGLPTGKREIRLETRSCDAIIGNPPYINAKEMRAEDKNFYHNSARTSWPRYPWRKAADIYTYFWVHAEQFLRQNGRLVLLTQAGWLDVDYGIPLQKWILDNFKIIAILETEAEPWFTDARVATAVTVLQRELDRNERQTTLVRFVQFHSRLASMAAPSGSEPERQRAFASLKDRLLGHRTDSDNPDYRIRILSQADLETEGTDRNNNYAGSKWGRYLRSTEALYALQKAHPNRFVALNELAKVQRGLTTNRDEFFIVEKVSDEALTALPSNIRFRERFGVSRPSVQAGEKAIIRRKDGVEFAIESRYLKPIIKTARDVNKFETRGLDHEYAVAISDSPRRMTMLARAYVEAGEREHWHQQPSFEAIQRAGGHWYSLRDVDSAPVLFIKTMQYSPVVLLNNAQLLANQRLYTIRPENGIDATVLCAVLNSTIFAAERYAAVKALGREAAIDVEVFSASILRTPDVRHLTSTDADALRNLMMQLAQREVGMMAEEPLFNMGHEAAVSYTAMNPIQQALWPIELRDATREQIDTIVLRLIGVPEGLIGPTRIRLVDELVTHTRKLRLLELEAQINRQGAGRGSGISPRQLADEIWTHLIKSNHLAPRRIPSDFLPETHSVTTVRLAGGRVFIEEPNLFNPDGGPVAKVGDTILFRGSREQVTLLAQLSSWGVTGDVALPTDPAICASVLENIWAYHTEYSRRFWESVAEVTSDSDLQARILREGWKRVLMRG